MKTEIQETELYKQFKKALNIQHDMRPDDNPFVVACCEIAENYAKQKLNIHGVMQAEVSDGAKGAAVGNSAVGQSGRKAICGHEHQNVIWKNYKAYDQCLLCGEVWEQI